MNHQLFKHVALFSYVHHFSCFCTSIETSYDFNQPAFWSLDAWILANGALWEGHQVSALRLSILSKSASDEVFLQYISMRAEILIRQAKTSPGRSSAWFPLRSLLFSSFTDWKLIVCSSSFGRMHTMFVSSLKPRCLLIGAFSPPVGRRPKTVFPRLERLSRMIASRASFSSTSVTSMRETSPTRRVLDPNVHQPLYFATPTKRFGPYILYNYIWYPPIDLPTLHFCWYLQCFAMFVFFGVLVHNQTP